MIAHAGDDVDCDETSLLATCAAEDVGADGLAPSYRGFKGDVILKKAGSYQALGRVERLDDTKVLIDELPLRKWTHDYKQWFVSRRLVDSRRGRCSHRRDRTTTSMLCRMRARTPSTRDDGITQAPHGRLEPLQQIPRRPHGRRRLLRQRAVARRPV